MTTTSSATIATAKASGYLQQLCKHFQHKLPVEFDPQQGQIEFPIGKCSLSAEGDVLTINVAATSADVLPQLRDVVERHLVRFAFREELAVNWA